MNREVRALRWARAFPSAYTQRAEAQQTGAYFAPPRETQSGGKGAYSTH